MKAAVWVPAEGAPVKVNPTFQLNIWMHLKTPNKCCRCISVKPGGRRACSLPCSLCCPPLELYFYDFPIRTVRRGDDGVRKMQGGKGGHMPVCVPLNIQLFM